MSEKVDYQIGENSTDKTAKLNDSGELFEFEYENAAIFRRIANDIYESIEAGIREPLQNSITAVKNAEADGYIDREESTINIIARDGDRVDLIIEDNGVGISRDVLDTVLSVVGRSTNRDEGDVSGKYGMGFLACYKLVGTDGGFIMHTNCRANDNAPLKGIWKPAGFDVDTEDKLDTHFGPDQYGTRLEFKLKNDIGSSQKDDIQVIREFVEKHSRWARRSVRYQEYDEDGRLAVDEEYGTKNLEEAVEDSSEHKIHIENEFFEAVVSPSIQKETVLINSPIQRNSDKSNFGHIGDCIIRFKNENGAIVKGPNKGLQPVNDGEYDQMDPDRQVNYIREGRVCTPSSEGEIMSPSTDIKIPKPTGTRDTLEREDLFWDWFDKRVKQKYTEKIQEVFNKFNSTGEFLYDLNQNERNLIQDGINRYNLCGDTVKETRDNIDTEFGTSVSFEVGSIIHDLDREVYHVLRGCSTRQASRTVSNSKLRRKTVHQILNEYDIENGDVYMSVTFNKREKMDAVWEDNDGNIIIRVQSSKQYEPLEKFGWKKLRDVPKIADSLDISDETEEKLTQSKKKTSDADKSTPEEIGDRSITVRDQNGKHNKTLDQIREEFADSDDILIMFPNSDSKISNHYRFSRHNISIANSLVKEFEYLNDLDSVYHINEWYNRVDEIELNTSEGTLSGRELIKKSLSGNKEILYHVLRDDSIEYFERAGIQEEMKTIVNSEYDISKKHVNNRTRLRNISQDDVIYAPITKSEMDILEFHYNNGADKAEVNEKPNIISGDLKSFNTDRSLNRTITSDLYWYAMAQLPLWKGTEELDKFNGANSSFNEEDVWFIDQISQSEYDLKSQVGMDILDESETFTVQTNKGELTLQEIIESYENVFVHLLSEDAKKAIMNTETVDAYAQDVLENQHPNEVDMDNSIYIPVTENEEDKIEEIIEERGSRVTINNTRKSARLISLTGSFPSLNFRQKDKYAKLYNVNTAESYVRARVQESYQDHVIDLISSGKMADELCFIETIADSKKLP